MKRFFLRFLIAHRRRFLALSFLLFIAAMALPMIACGVPTWLTDANSVITLVGASFTSIASFVAGLTGNVALSAALAVVSTWITKIETGLSDVEALVQQYNQDQNPTVLTDIEAALADVETNVQQDFSNLGLPSSIMTVISGIAGLALSQLQAWGSLIPALKAKAMEKVSLTVPMTKKEFQAAVNKFLDTPTGDPVIDAALAKAKRV